VTDKAKINTITNKNRYIYPSPSINNIIPLITINDKILKYPNLMYIPKHILSDAELQDLKDLHGISEIPQEMIDEAIQKKEKDTPLSKEPIPSPNSSISYILDNIEKFESMKSILILCHNRIVRKFNKNFDYHWWGPNIIQIMEHYKFDNLDEDMIVDTVDIMPGGTYVEDAFSDEFINKHINHYDVLVVPDCGGPWYELQITSQYHRMKKVKDYTKEEININIKLLIDLSLKLTKVVKPNGIINFCKFLHAGEIIIEGNKFLDFKDALLFYLNKNGFYAEFSGYGIIGIKKNYTSLIIDLAQDSYNINNKRQSLSEKDRKELIEKINN
jgi:hypothetical protein